MDTQVKVTLITQTGPIEKVAKQNAWTQAGFRAPIQYTLEDGRTVGTTERSRLKRDLVKFLDRLPAAPEYTTHATFNDDGTFYGTRITFNLGGAR